MLTDDQVLRWFGPPVAAMRNRVPVSVPNSLHADWRLLKKHGYTNAEALTALQPSIARLSDGGRLLRR